MGRKLIGKARRVSVSFTLDYEVLRAFDRVIGIASANRSYIIESLLMRAINDETLIPTGLVGVGPGEVGTENSKRGGPKKRVKK